MRNYFSYHHDPCLCHPTGLDHAGTEADPAVSGTALRVLTLNVRHGRGPRHRPGIRDVERFRENVRRIAAFLRDRPADVVALQEADGPSFWSGSEHHVERYLAEGGFEESAHGLHFTLCRPRFGLSYGTALLSRLPLSSVESRRFRARPLDPKGYVVATVPFAGREVDVVSVHLDVFAPVRRRQVETLTRVLRPRPRPLILMGDLNSRGTRARSAVRRLMAELELHAGDGDPAPATWPSWRPRFRLDWVLASRDLAFLDRRTVHEPVSDHLAVEASIAFR